MGKDWKTLRGNEKMDVNILFSQTSEQRKKTLNLIKSRVDVKQMFEYSSLISAAET